MTWPPHGRNVDIFVAAAALALGLWPRAISKQAVWAFAVLGLLALVNILVTAMRSLAHPLRPPSWEPGLEAVAQPPYVLLPGFLVQLAVGGHLLLLRKLLSAAPVASVEAEEEKRASMM
mmetsp:Transcript_44073/g.143021  ORF Transcript_44073/g.143021 Transcript_44073/m.143021 type:complete len:119 (+) Transcript_44073:473-829(+)